MNQIAFYLLQMILPGCLGALLWWFTRLFRRRRREKKGLSSGSARERTLFLFFVFASGLLALTLTPADFWHDTLILHRLPSAPRFSLDRVNLTPVRETWKLYRYYARRGLWSFLLINFLGNIVMFMPNGFFTALLMDKPRWWKSALATFGLSLFIEVFQLFISRGTDVDDLILNTLGGLCGYWVFLLFRCVNPSYVRRCAKSK